MVYGIQTAGIVPSAHGLPQDVRHDGLGPVGNELDRVDEILALHAKHPESVLLGESIGLEWGDLDFRERFLEDRRAYKNGAFARPKNGRSRRVDLFDQCLHALSALRKYRAAQALASGTGTVAGPIFRGG